MAKALECPACGAKHRLDGLEPSTTFRCERCGQTLKVPASVAAARADADAQTASSASPSGTATIPPPRRRTSGAAPVREVVGVSATVAASASDDDSGDGGNGQPPQAAPRTRGATASRRRVHWYWRIVAWVVAVPLGFLITAWPAYEFNLIKKDDVLNVFVGSGTGRYTRLAVGTLVWALVTALLVQLFVEGGRLWVDRRQRRREAGALRGARASG